MKLSLGIAAMGVMLFSVGCMNTPPQPGPPGAQGQSGQAGQAGQPGQPGPAGDAGATGQTGQTGQQGQAAPCPTGQHRFTNPETGKISCVSD